MSELDDIERVLDHAEKPWMLTDSEIMEAQGVTGVKMLDDKTRAIATAAVKKYQEWLASQCGPNPCIGCEAPGEDACREVIGMCSKWYIWHGIQAGLAKGLQERGK